MPTGLIDFSKLPFEDDEARQSDGLIDFSNIPMDENGEGRSFGDVAEDSWRSFASGTNKMFASLASLVGADQAAEMLKSGAEYWDEGVSPELKLARYEAQLRAQERAKENGDGVLGFIQNAGGAAGDLLTNPDLLVDSLAGSLPYLLPGGAATRVGAAIGAARAGAAGATLGARIGSAAGGAVLEGADARMGARDSIDAMTHEDMLQHMPGYADAYADRVAYYRHNVGLIDKAEIEALAQQDMLAFKEDAKDAAGRTAFGTAAATSAATGWLGSKPDAAVFGGKAAREGASLGTGWREGAKMVGIEAAEEVPEEMANQFGQNLGVANYGDERRALDEGVAEAGGQGLVVGAVQGGGLKLLTSLTQRVKNDPENADPTKGLLSQEEADEINLFTDEERAAMRAARGEQDQRIEPTFDDDVPIDFEALADEPRPTQQTQQEQLLPAMLEGEAFDLPTRQPEAAEPVPGPGGTAGDVILSELRRRNKEQADAFLRQLGAATQRQKVLSENLAADAERVALAQEYTPAELPDGAAPSTERAEGETPETHAWKNTATAVESLRQSIREYDNATRALAAGARAGRREDTAPVRAKIAELQAKREEAVSQGTQNLATTLAGSGHFANARTYSPKHSTLLEAVAHLGGVNAPYASSHGFDPADMSKTNTDVSRRTGLGVFKKTGGSTFDQLGERLHEDGYFNTRPTENQVLDAVQAELRGTPQYSNARVALPQGVPSVPELAEAAKVTVAQVESAVRQIQSGGKLSAPEARVREYLRGIAGADVDTAIAAEQEALRAQMRPTRGASFRVARTFHGLANEKRAEAAGIESDLLALDEHDLRAEADRIEQAMYDTGALKAANWRSLSSLAFDLIRDIAAVDLSRAEALYREADAADRAGKHIDLDAIVAARDELVSRQNGSENTEDAGQDGAGFDPETAERGDPARDGPSTGRSESQQGAATPQDLTPPGPTDGVSDGRKSYRRDSDSARIISDIDRRRDAYKRLLLCLKA